MLGVAGVTSCFAQGNVYSVNVVGYINVDLAAGYAMVANQLDNGNGNLARELVPAPPIGTTFYKFNGASYDQLQFVGVWIGATTMTLAPGEGAFIRVTSPTTLTFVGEVLQGDLRNPLSSGYEIYSSMVPQAGLLQGDLGYSPIVGDTVFRWNGTGYTQYQFVGVWIPSQPSINVGESFWLRTGTARDWQRVFNVN